VCVCPHSKPLTRNTGSPQCCILSPLLYSLCTHDCVARFSSNTVKFADDTVVVGLISGNDEKAYLGEVANLSTTSEVLLGMNGTAVERVSSYR